MLNMASGLPSSAAWRSQKRAWSSLINRKNRRFVLTRTLAALALGLSVFALMLSVLTVVLLVLTLMV